MNIGNKMIFIIQIITKILQTLFYQNSNETSVKPPKKVKSPSLRVWVGFYEPLYASIDLHDSRWCECIGVCKAAIATYRSVFQ